MRPVESNVTVTDALPSLERKYFSIGDPRWVMRANTKLYSSNEAAIAREYATNAFDAQVEAGYDGPIEVSLPSMMNDHMFVIRDNGTGMSREILTSRFTEFGTSSKRESDAYNGVLGFGSKSALAYTTTFNISSVHNGRKTEATVLREPDYSIAIDIMRDESTDEPNGTEISIPIHDVDKFNHIAGKVYRFWRPGTILVDGQEPNFAVGDKLDDDLYYSEDTTSYVVMGNVGYPINNPAALFNKHGMRPITFVAFVPNGAVEFVPSREALDYTPHTIATLQRVIDDFAAKILAQAKSEIASASNHFDAYVAWSNWTERLGRSLFADLEFKGEKLSHTLPINCTRYRIQGYGYSTRTEREWAVEKMKDTLIITDYQLTLSSAHKAKAREYLGLKGIKANYVLFTAPAKVSSPWVDQNRVVTWENLKAAIPKKPREYQTTLGGLPRRIPGKWDYFTSTRFHQEADIPDGADVYYVTTATAKTYKVREILEVLEWTNSVVVKLASNRVDKFTRDNPKAKEFITEAKTQVIYDAASLVPERAKKVVGMNYDDTRWLETLDVTKIDDPLWAEVKQIRAEVADLMKPYHNALRLANILGVRYNGVKEFTGKPVDIRKDYPLLHAMSVHSVASHKAHVYTYMNAAYAAKKGN